MWTSLKDHVSQGLPPFSDTNWWSPVVSMAMYKPLISLHISEVSLTVAYVKSCDVM